MGCKNKTLIKRVLFAKAVFLFRSVRRAATADNSGDRNRWVKKIIITAAFIFIFNMASTSGQSRDDGEQCSNFHKLNHNGIPWHK